MSQPASPSVALYSGVTGGSIEQSDILELTVHLGGTEEVSSFAYRLQNWNGKYSTTGSPIALGEDGYIMLGRGANCPQLITTRNENMKFQSTPTEHYVTVSGRDWGERLFREYVTESYALMKGEEIVKHLLDYHSGLPHVRGTAELVEDTDTTFTRLDFENKQAWEILKQIAKDSDKAGAIGYDFRVALDGRFEFFHRGAKTCPVNLNELIEEAETESDILSVRNKVTIYGAATKSIPIDVDETVESLTPAGGYWTGYGGNLSLDATRQYGSASSSVKNTTGTAYNAVSVYYFNVTVNGNLYPKLFLALLRDDQVKSDGFLVILHDSSSRVCGRNLSNVNSVSASNDWSTYQLDVGLNHASEWAAPADFDWENIRTVTVTAYLVTPGVSGQVWHGQLYFTGARYSNMQTDAASIAVYGERQYVDIVEDLCSDNECMLRAKSILAYKKQAKTSLVVKSTLIDYGTSPILPGDMISVTLPNENISSVNFLVKSVDYHLLAENNTLDVTLNLGYQKQLMADWIYALRTRTDALSNYKARR
ncbi:MAG: hypothetical protein NWE96_06590 [Candidatus Bathyarchaeota archaeon]|nr:hypothetical protein [Candidatus Bathyarchaeota archaeon]